MPGIMISAEVKTGGQGNEGRQDSKERSLHTHMKLTIYWADKTITIK